MANDFHIHFSAHIYVPSISYFSLLQKCAIQQENLKNLNCIKTKKECCYSQMKLRTIVNSYSYKPIKFQIMQLRNIKILNKGTNASNKGFN